MAYIIYNSDGTILMTLPDGEVDSSATSLDLVGKNVNNYGQFFNNNLVKLLTNFADVDGNSPVSPQIGQLWFNKTTNRLTVYDGDSFKPTYGSTVAGTAPVTTSTGDLWFDSVNRQLKVWDGDEFHLVGPAVSTVQGKFGLEPPPVTIRDFGTNLPQQVGIFYSYGDPVALVSQDDFVMSPNTASVYLNTSTSTAIVAGLTVFDNLDIKGDIYVDGSLQHEPNKVLSTYRDISSYGSPTSQVAIDNANNAIIDDLEKLFPIQTISTLTQVGFTIGSEARVLCNYSGATSVRRFRVSNRGFGPEWLPFNLYYTGSVSTLTNIVI